MKARLSNYDQSPRKVRLVANAVRGKSVLAAQATLSFLPKKSSEALLKLLNSAVSNARQHGETPENLFVRSISVDKGIVLRRFTPKARGRAATIRRTRSIVNLELGVVAPKAAKRSAKKRAPAA